ncbi:NAD(P)-dependent oxidoreductase [Demequina rhizosphaerae]|uniref:NAD(P)-dependent oxidoreductase n=1 Tax=Demequina rhizosphaerae TaxID=1638985 RepID=UPI00078558B2|nr:NAD(P)-dependent oxidoreductase [Demequina rhizosphaerae]
MTQTAPTPSPEGVFRTLTIAVLGTGIMGSAMTRNLVRAGHGVRVWNRTHATAAALAADGATVASTPTEAVAEADVVLTMLHDGPVTLEVMRHAAPGLRPGTLWVQCATVGLDLQPAIAALADELDITLVDAPVLGTREPAELGTLTVLAAGPEDVRATLASVFDAVAMRTFWVGDDAAAGAAQRLKLVANAWVLSINNAAGEVISLAQGLGVPPELFFELIENGPLDLGYLRTKAALILEDRLAEVSFGATTAAKDADLILAAAGLAGVRLDGLEGARARLDRVVEDGHGAEDMAAAYRAS